MVPERTPQTQKHPDTDTLRQAEAALPGKAEPEDLCGHLNLRIDREGVWYFHDSPIGRKELVCLFSSVLRRGEDGRFWLVTPGESGVIDVEDAPFMAVEMFRAGTGEHQVLSFRTNVDEIVTVDDDHPIHVETDPLTDEPSPYVRVRDGLDARMTRSVYYELVAHSVEVDGPSGPQIGVWSSGTFFPLGNLEET